MADEFTKAALYGIKTFNKKVKEKIGMQKLVMLLDIYEEEVVGVHSVGEHITEKDEAWIISKKFGFIKWLVQHHKLLHPDFVQHLKLFYGDSMPEENFYLMMLAISPNPIEELCKMLRPN